MWMRQRTRRRSHMGESENVISLRARLRALKRKKWNGPKKFTICRDGVVGGVCGLKMMFCFFAATRATRIPLRTHAHLLYI